ncbi:MAG: YxeA family protein [Lachnospiraceae bacterium]|nr:YxeA family protein [Lachnospiraceae bacterium]
MKKQIKIAIGAAAVLLIGLIGFCAWFLSGSGSTEYYSQIDNSKVEQVDAKGGVISLKGNLPYSYTLLSYDENGNEKEITFGTSPGSAGALYSPGKRVVSRKSVSPAAKPPLG